jgi:hypothetical protein
MPTRITCFAFAGRIAAVKRDLPRIPLRASAQIPSRPKYARSVGSKQHTDFASDRLDRLPLWPEQPRVIEAALDTIRETADSRAGNRAKVGSEAQAKS